MTTQLRDAEATARRLDWQRLLRWAAILVMVEYLVVMTLVERTVIPPLVIVMIVFVVGLVRMRAGGDRGVRVTTVGFVLALLVVVVLALPSLLVPASLPSFVVTWAAFATTVPGLVAGIARWRGRTGATAVTRMVMGGAAVAVIATLVGVTASLGYTNAKAQPGDIVVRAKDSSFVPAKLTASHGQVTFFLDNADSTLHDFEITGVGSDGKNMPANHQTRYTVTLAAGTYEFHCQFHDGMTGTLVVS